MPKILTYSELTIHQKINAKAYLAERNGQSKILSYKGKIYRKHILAKKLTEYNEFSIDSGWYL